MLSFYGDQGFWATYYSSTDWTNPIDSKAEVSIDFSHVAGAAPVLGLSAGYSIRWRGFCLMPHTGPITMSFSKSIGTYELITDGRALLSSEATAVQMELLYSLSMINNTVNNTVRLDWASLTTVTSKVTSSMQFALEYGKIHHKNMQQISVIPGFCSLKTSSINGNVTATIGTLQRLRLTLKDLFENICALSPLAIAAYAVGQTHQIPLYEKSSTLNAVWESADLYTVKHVLGKSRSGPEMTLFHDTSCSSEIRKLIIQSVDMDLTNLDQTVRCLKIEGLIELSAMTSYSIRAHVETSYRPSRAELSCSINLTVSGVGSNVSRDVDSITSTISSSVFVTTYMPGFVHFSLMYIHSQNCHRIKLILDSYPDTTSSLRSAIVDSSNSGMILESSSNEMRIRVTKSSTSPRIHAEVMLSEQESLQLAGDSLVKSLMFSCRDENNFGSLCKTEDFHASVCPSQKGRRCSHPTIGFNFEFSQSVAFKPIITVSSQYKQSLAIATGIGLWATYYEDAYMSLPIVSFVEPNITSLSFNFDLSSFYFPISSQFSARWAGYMRANVDSVTTMSSISLPISDSLMVWVDNSKVIDQQFTSASQSGTIFLQANTLFEIEVEYKFFGMGLAKFGITFPAATLYFTGPDDFQSPDLNVEPAASINCQLVTASDLITLITFGIPVSFSLFCEDRYNNSISKSKGISVVIISEDSPITHSSYSHNSSFWNNVVVISSVVYCCVSKLLFRVGIDDAVFNSPSFETRASTPADGNTLIIGPSILTSGFAAEFVMYPRDVFNNPAYFGNHSNEIRLYLGHMSVFSPNVTRLERNRHSITSTYSILASARIQLLIPNVIGFPLFIHQRLCQSGYLVRVFSSDLPVKASLIYEFTLSSIKDLNIML